MSSSKKFPRPEVLILSLIAKPNAPTELGVSYNWAEAYIHHGYKVTFITHLSQKVHFEDYAASDHFELHFLGTGSSLPANPSSLWQAARLLWTSIGWQISVRKWVRHADRKFHLVHHPSISSVRLPSPLFILEGFNFWGPLGGGHLGNLSRLTLKNFAYESIRNFSILVFKKIARIAIGPRTRMNLTTLATNSPTLQLLEGIGFAKVIFELSDGIAPPRMSRKSADKLMTASDPVKIIWAGRIVESKRPRVAILALSNLLSRNLNAELHFFGNGQQEPLVGLAKDLGVQKQIIFHGAVSPNYLMDCLPEYDVSLFTSGRDSSSPFLLESLYAGLRCIAIRTEVIKSIFPEDIVSGPSEENFDENTLAEFISMEIEKWIVSEKESRVSVVTKGREFAERQTWVEKAKRILEIREGQGQEL